MNIVVSIASTAKHALQSSAAGAAAQIRFGAPLAMALALLAACSAKPAPKDPDPPQVSVVTVHRSNVPVTVELPGRTSAYRVAEVRARVDGIVQKRGFVEGDQVERGQHLYQIDPAPYIAALNSADASLQKAKANLAATNAQAERYKALVAQNLISRQDYDNAVSSQGQAEADVATAKAAIAIAKINLDYTNVVSPITGRTGVSAVTEGAYVQASAATLMDTVQQIDPIYVDLTQSSVEGLQLRRNLADGSLKLDGSEQAKAALFLEDGTPYPIAGTLQFSDITVDQGTGSVTVRAIFANPKSVLLPGMFVRARIDEGSEDDAISVPEVGVTHDPNGQATALVVGPDNKVVLRTLKVRGTQANQWIVESGLVDGERVIVSGVQKVRPGMLVSATEAVPVATPPAATTSQATVQKTPAPIPAASTKK